MMKRRAWIPCAFLIASSLASGLCAQDEAVLYKAARVEPISGPTLKPGQVLVVNGKIKALGNALSVPEGTEVVDLGDATLMPGLVNAYDETGLAGGSNEVTLEVTPGFEASSAIDWKSRGFVEAAASGTTTMAVSPGTENVISGLSTVVKTGGAVDTRTLKDHAALLISLCSDPARRNNSRQRPDSIYVRQPTNRMGVVWILRHTFDSVKRQPAEADAWLKTSLDGERPVFAVARTMHDLTTLLTLSDELGFSPIAVGGHEADQVKELLAAAKVPVILEPISASSLTGPERTTLIWNQAGVLHEAGIEVALSGRSLLEQARFAHRFGLPAKVALEAVTQTPARLLRVADRVGSLAPGMDADMIALDGDPLEFTTAIRWVMVNGTILERQKGESRGSYDL